MAQIHREPYVTLAGLTEHSALIAWGAFFFEVTGVELDGRFKLIEDKNLSVVNPPRKNSIGESSNFYGPAKVRVQVKDQPQTVREFTVPGTTAATAVNHVLADGLAPNTTYQYEVLVNHQPWAAEQRRDWVFRGNKQGMFLDGGRYVNEFTTFPDRTTATPDFTFAVIGDYGRGVRKPSDDKRRQREIAAALQTAVNTKGVRFVLTTGDHIYGEGGFFGLGSHDTGNEDSDWFFTHYQPYRYLLNRVPFFPACGNHDTDETEKSDDYDQLLDNFYIRTRFLSSDRDEGEAVKEHGLFHQFHFGRDVEFVSLDSARRTPGDPRAFEQPINQAFLTRHLPAVTGAPTVWRIPFFHHPPFVDGPTKNNDTAAQQHLVTRFFEPGGVRLVFNGHEHNFQVSRHNGIHYVLTGAAGDLRAGSLRGDEDAHNIAWAAKHHFLLVEYRGGKMHITPYSESGNPLSVQQPNGQSFPLPLVVSLT